MSEVSEVSDSEQPSIVVTGGGEPTAEELAALVIALSPVAQAEAADAAGDGWSAWGEAALLEGVGFRPFVSVDDVVRYHRSLA